MNNRNRKTQASIKTELDLTADTLKGKQSVRATFRLPSQAIDLLSIAATQLGLKQKSLFDQLVENRSVLDQVANEARDYETGVNERRQKTFVLSRNSLDSLEQIAVAHKMPRDVLVEVSIRRLMPVISAEQAKQRERTLLLQDLKQFLKQGLEILHKSEKSLGPDDPVSKKITTLTDSCARNIGEIEELVEKGRLMDQL
ncbi:MAG: hypothetical protein KKG47_16640 [Proteobacteria bacterium]|nr:hypothetical protein [Pseudomonadota bacterium]MBU1738672.1 hypothetical protein [Pseudomonadota bacterium]